jgi:hypothetical protein
VTLQKMRKIEIHFKRIIQKFQNHLWNDITRRAIHDWLNLVFSYRGIWCFIPAILGVIFVYWANYYSKSLILKEYHEILAIYLMSIAVIIFLVRSLLYRLEIDYILLIMAVNFLCREIHFVGTDNAVVIVAAIVFVWILYWKDRLWANIENAKAVQIALVGTAFTYFLSILIARRVFSINHLGLLPNEAHVHIALEEVLENIAHLYLIFIGILAFFSIPAKKPKKSNSIY